MREHHPRAPTDTERLNEAIIDLSKKGALLIDSFFAHCGSSETNSVYLKFVADELWQFDFTFPQEILEVTTLNEQNEDVVYDFESVEGKFSLMDVDGAVDAAGRDAVDSEVESFYPDDLFHQIEPDKALLYVEDGQPSYKKETLYIQIGTNDEPRQTLLACMKRIRDGRSSMSSFEYQVGIGPEEEIVRKKIWTYRAGQIHHNYIQCVMDPVAVEELSFDQRIDACREGVDVLGVLYNEMMAVSEGGEDGDDGEWVNSRR